jgi:hypothetical protein
LKSQITNGVWWKTKEVLAKMPYAFDTEKLNELLYIINGGPCCQDDGSWLIQKSVVPAWLEALDPETVMAESNRLVLGGNADGLMDTCMFLLDATSGTITFVADYLQPREELGPMQAPAWWISAKPYPQPTETNMWIAVAEAIKGELLKCRTLS